MENYIINENTLAIISNYDNIEVVENYIVYNFHGDINEFIDISCRYYGSSFRGRRDSSEYLLGITYKSPIVLSEVKRIIFFPLFSLKENHNIWLNYSAIEEYSSKNDENFTFVKLCNGRVINAAVNRSIFNKQLLRASRLDSIFNDKKRK